MNDPMEFIHRFITYADTNGIYDEYDKDSNKMKTSSGVEQLIKEAKAFFPNLPKGVSAAMMRDLTDEQRDASIEGNDKVVDLRGVFSKKMAENGGAQGLLTQLADAYASGDAEEIRRISEMAATFKKYEKGEEV